MADFDGDGTLDLVGRRYGSSNALHTRPTNSCDPNTFISHEIPYINQELMLVADIDGDNDIDIVSSDPNDWWMRNNGFPNNSFEIVSKFPNTEMPA